MSHDLKLKLLQPHDDALQKCVYCPKLSRAACPVSNTTFNETHTPWGKMSTAYFMGRGDVPVDADHGATAWACSGCFGCREKCDHKNDVAGALNDTRAEMFQAGVMPVAVKRLVKRLPDMAREYRDQVDVLDPKRDMQAPIGLALGCSYTRQLPGESVKIVRLVEALLDKPVRLLRGCCGLPWLHAGDREGFERRAHELHDETQGTERVIAADPGCARLLMHDSPKHANADKPVSPLVDILYAAIERLPALALEGTQLRYHDACQLGRGLGRYEEPRAVLARLTGAPPAELPRQREHAECSGAGGLLPATMPQTSRAIADARIEEHREAGGGTMVSACPSTVRRLRSRGERARDLASLVADAFLQHDATTR